MDLTQQAKKLFANDHFATQAAGIEIDSVTDTETRCSMRITPAHCNAAGRVMGGALFTLADFAFAVAANTICLSEGRTDNLWMSLDSSIRFLAPVRGRQVSAVTTCIRQGSTICCYQTDIRDGQTLIATIQTTGIKPTHQH